MASWRDLATYVDRVRAVTAEDVRRVARAYLTESSRTVGWYDPIQEGRASAGDAAPAEAAGAGAPSRWVDHFHPESSPDGAFTPFTAGFASPAAPAATGGAAHATALPYRTVLPNGLTLIVRRNSANPTVSLQGLVRAGGIYDPSGKSGLAGFTAALLDQGTAKRSAFQIAETV